MNDAVHPQFPAALLALIERTDVQADALFFSLLGCGFGLLIAALAIRKKKPLGFVLAIFGLATLCASFPVENSFRAASVARLCRSVPNAAVVDKKSSAAARQAAHQRFGSSDVDYHRYWGGELSVIIKWQTDSNYDVSLTYYRSRFYTAMSSFFDVYVTNPAANGCASLHK